MLPEDWVVTDMGVDELATVIPAVCMYHVKLEGLLYTVHDGAVNENVFAVESTVMSVTGSGIAPYTNDVELVGLPSIFTTLETPASFTAFTVPV